MVDRGLSGEQTTPCRSTPQDQKPLFVRVAEPTMVT